jgi:hypothetical protein
LTENSAFAIDTLRDRLVQQKEITRVRTEERDFSKMKNRDWRRYASEQHWDHTDEIVQLREQLRHIQYVAWSWGKAAQDIYPKVRRIRVRAAAMAKATYLGPSSLWTQFLDEVNEALKDFPLEKKSRFSEVS